MTEPLKNFRLISVNEFLALGLPQIAYIKDIKTVSGDQVISLNAANGQQLAITKSRIQAQQIAYENGLMPLTVH